MNRQISIGNFQSNHVSNRVEDKKTVEKSEVCFELPKKVCRGLECIFLQLIFFDLMDLFVQIERCFGMREHGFALVGSFQIKKKKTGFLRDLEKPCRLRNIIGKELGVRQTL